LDRYGYFGRVLFGDLSTDTLEERPVADEIYENFLGGYGLGAKLIYDWTRKKYDSLGPEAILGILPGLLTGTVAPFSGRYMVCGKSPLTGGWGDANSGGYFGPAIKKAGYDGIFVTGEAESPKYLLISDDELNFKDASDLWELDTVEADVKLQKTHGHGTKVALIGPAGEHVSLISGVVNDKGRIAARSGLGAVMGKKKLKAIAISKKGVVPVKDKAKLAEIAQTYNNRLNKKPNKIVQMIVNAVPNFATMLRWVKLPLSGPAKMVLEIYRQYGTSIANSVSSEIGDSPVKNWSGIGYIDFPQEKSRKISGAEFLKYKKRSFGCATCPAQCGSILSAPDVDPNLQETHRPEYETSCMFGALLVNDDLGSILKLNDMCNRAGIDSISTGATVAFAIECFEEGILTTEDTDGLELHWGDSGAILKLTEMIINRQGIGDILADGTMRAAERIGKGSEEYAMHAGGEELPAHDPRLSPSLASTYSTDPTPGRHTAASIDFEAIGPIKQFIPGLFIPRTRTKYLALGAEAQKTMVGLMETLSSVGLCMFTTLFGAFPLLELVEAVTGWHWHPDDALLIGRRIQTMRLAFSLREGINPYMVTLPGRVWGEDPHGKGPHKGKTIKYKEMNRYYYESMDWDPLTGIPTKESLESVGLGDLFDDIQP